GVDLLGHDAGVDAEAVAARLDRHHDLLHRRVAGALADAVHRALDLARAVLHRGERVRDRHAEVVVAVGAQDAPLAAGHALAGDLEERAVLLGQRVAGRVGHVHGARAGVDHRAEDLDQVLRVAARGVLGRELDVVEVLLGAPDGPHRRVEHVLPAHHELVLQVDVGGGDEDVDPGPFRLLDRLDGTVHVLLARAGEREDDRLRDRRGHAPDGLEVALGGGGEAGLDHVHPQVLQLARDRELLLHVHGGAGRLLAVAQGGVEDLYPVHGRLLYASSSRKTPGATNRPARGPRNKKATGGWSRPWHPLEKVRVLPYTPPRAAGGRLSSRPRASRRSAGF